MAFTHRPAPLPTFNSKFQHAAFSYKGVANVANSQQPTSKPINSALPDHAETALLVFNVLAKTSSQKSEKQGGCSTVESILVSSPQLSSSRAIDLVTPEYRQPRSERYLALNLR